MASQEKITVYNLADLKNTSDDAITNYLSSLKFTQSHRLADVRLALGYSAFAVAAACFGWDYKFGFESTKYYTAAAVVLYVLFNGALTLWIWLVEAAVVYVGTSPSGETISIATSTKKNVPIYDLTITISPKSASSKPETIALARPFAEWFDAAGHFVAAPFQTMLATTVPAIGKLDAKRLASAVPAASGGAAPAPEYTPEMLDAVLAASGVNSAAASGSAKKSSGGKRRKA